MPRSLVLGALCVVLSLTAAAARDTRPGEAKAAAQPTPIRAVSVAGADGDQACSRTRRRLWLQGEGWVVRKIATCR